MRISDWISDVCSSDLKEARRDRVDTDAMGRPVGRQLLRHRCLRGLGGGAVRITRKAGPDILRAVDDDRPALSARDATARELGRAERSEERRVGKECVSTCRSRWSPYP